MSIDVLFKDKEFKYYIEKYLACLFEEAQRINTNDNAMNMNVGRDREDAIKLIFKKWISKKYNSESVINVLEKLDYDAVFFDKKTQIKTITVNGNATGKLKLNWASGLDNAQIFKENFSIDNDIIYVRILNKNKKPYKISLHYIPVSSQKEVFESMGLESYLKITEKDSKGILLSTKALKLLIHHKETLVIEINYNVPNPPPFKTRLEFWEYRLNQYENENYTNSGVLDLHICKNSLEEFSSILTR